MNIHSISTAVLKEAVEIREQIEELEQRLSRLLGGATPDTEPLDQPTRTRRKRRLSPEGRARIAEAVRARWARQKGLSLGSSVETPSDSQPRRRRRLSPEGRARIAAASRARWARQKAASSFKNNP